MSPELLAPAGDMQALIAAFAAGADAVYLGAQAFNARMSAGNFDRPGLLRALDYAHEREKKVYVTVNTLVKQSELTALIDLAGQLYEAGADAALVQDLGALRVLARTLPDLPLHASTQMAIHNRQGARFARRAGLRRVVLAREASFEEMAACAREGVEIEVFAHGALCVSCSGQCLFSSLVGGRSGNRGQCAQPCRLPYALVGAVRASGYLLSPADLMTLNELPRYAEAGVACLKIEGRLKRPEYVSVVTAIYRRALDALEAFGEYEPAQEDILSLAQVFNRGGFTRGYAGGLVDRELMAREKPNHMGVRVGAVLAGGRVRLSADVEAADRVALRRADGEDEWIRGLAGRAGETVSARLPAFARENAPVYRLVSEAQTRAAREMAASGAPRSYVSGRLRARVGERARLWLTDGERVASAESAEPVAEREGAAGGDAARSRAQIAKFGGTPYELLDLAVDADERAFLPAAMLNDLRRRAAGALSEARIACGRAHLRAFCQYPLAEDARTALDLPLADGTRLVVQSPDADLLRKALLWGADEIALAPEDFTAAGLARLKPPDARFALALPPVLDAESLERAREWACQHRQRLDAVLVANVGQLVLDWGVPMRADYQLNVMNRAALSQVASLGAVRYTPSLELTAGEIRELDGQGGAREMIVYGRIPLMHLRHCPLRAQLGGPHEGCDRCQAAPENARVQAHALADRKGARFQMRNIRQEHGCLVCLYNCVPLMLLRHAGRLPPAATWRLLLTDEGEELARALVEAHRARLAGDPPGEGKAFQALLDLPTTTGHYFRGIE